MLREQQRQELEILRARKRQRVGRAATLLPETSTGAVPPSSLSLPASPPAVTNEVDLSYIYFLIVFSASEDRQPSIPSWSSRRCRHIGNPVAVLAHLAACFEPRKIGPGIQPPKPIKRQLFGPTKTNMILILFNFTRMALRVFVSLSGDFCQGGPNRTVFPYGSASLKAFHLSARVVFPVAFRNAHFYSPHPLVISIGAVPILFLS